MITGQSWRITNLTGIDHKKGLRRQIRLGGPVCRLTITQILNCPLHYRPKLVGYARPEKNLPDLGIPTNRPADCQSYR